MFHSYHRNAYVSQDSKNIAVLNWIGCFFTLFLFPIILYLAKTSDNYISEQAKEAINWSLTFIASSLGLFLIGIILSVIYEPLGFFTLAIATTLLMLSHLIFCFLGAVSCYHGKDFELTYIIRLFK